MAGRPKIDPKYLAQIQSLAQKGHKAKRITEEIASAAEKQALVDYPAYTTVRRYVAEYQKRTPQERADDQPFHWPESMEQADIPWEGAEIAFEALRHWRQEWPEPLSVGAMRWFWRVHQAANDLVHGDKLQAALWLSLSDEIDATEALPVRRTIELYILLAPWRDRTGGQWSPFLSELGLYTPEVLGAIQQAEARTPSRSALGAILTYGVLKPAITEPGSDATEGRLVTESFAEVQGNRERPQVQAVAVEDSDEAES